MPVPITAPPCPPAGDDMPAPPDVEVGTPAWYAWHNDVVAWGVRVMVCRARAAARAGD